MIIVRNSLWFLGFALRACAISVGLVLAVVVGCVTFIGAIELLLALADRLS